MAYLLSDNPSGGLGLPMFSFPCDPGCHDVTVTSHAYIVMKTASSEPHICNCEFVRMQKPGTHQPKTMKTRFLINTTIAALMLGTFTGCNRSPTFQTKLDKDEQMQQNAPVLVDNVQAGYVKALKLERGERVAVLVITNAEIVKADLKTGIVRVIEDGRINLQTDAVKADSTPLPVGAFIPAESKFAHAVGKVGSKKLLLVLSAAALCVLFILILLKAARVTGIIVLALLLAGITGQVLYPYLIPWVERLYQAAPAATASAAPVLNNATNQPATMHSMSGVISSVTKFLNHPPDARLVAFAAVFFVGFCAYALLLNGVIRVLKRGH